MRNECILTAWTSCLDLIFFPYDVDCCGGVTFAVPLRCGEGLPRTDGSDPPLEGLCGNSLSTGSLKQNVKVKKEISVLYLFS